MAEIDPEIYERIAVLHALAKANAVPEAAKKMRASTALESHSNYSTELLDTRIAGLSTLLEDRGIDPEEIKEGAVEAFDAALQREKTQAQDILSQFGDNLRQGDKIALVHAMELLIGGKAARPLASIEKTMAAQGTARADHLLNNRIVACFEYLTDANTLLARGTAREEMMEIIRDGFKNIRQEMVAKEADDTPTFTQETLQKLARIYAISTLLNPDNETTPAAFFANLNDPEKAASGLEKLEQMAINNRGLTEQGITDATLDVEEFAAAMGVSVQPARGVHTETIEEAPDRAAAPPIRERN